MTVRNKKQIEKIINKNNPDNAQSSEKAGMISGITGIICNIILCAVKFFVGSAANSVSVTADAVNNLSDAGSGIITLAGAKLSAKPVDKEHPFGHGRLEYVSALVVSFLIILMGLELGKSSVEKIISPQTVELSAWKVIILIISVGIKLWMAYINNNLFKVTGNLNTKATRQDSLGDCVATTATIISLIISHYTGFAGADGIIGLGVAVIILISGIGIIKDIIGPLLGQPPSKDLVSEIERIMLSEEYIIGVHDLIVHDYGPGRIIASAHAEVPADLDIVTIHTAIDTAEEKIRNELKIVICIHMDPIVVNDEEVNRYKKLTEEILNEFDPMCSFHDFRMVKSHTGVNLIFDLVIPFSKNNTPSEILNEVKTRFEKQDKSINLVITVEHSYV